MARRRRERIAHNEARFRAINEALEQEASDAEIAGFVCECGDLECAALIHLPFSTYQEVRSNPRRFVVRPGHESVDAEDVVERGARFVIVEKHEDLAHIVDPGEARTPPPV